MSDAKPRTSVASDKQQPTTSQKQEPTALDPGTWTGAWKYAPAYVAIAAMALWLLFVATQPSSGPDLTNFDSCVSTFDYSFRINAALSQSQDVSTKSWEIGYAHEATLQIFNPERSVFGVKREEVFPDGKLPSLGLRLDEASAYVQQKIRVRGRSLRDEERGAVSDPASLGVAALMLGQRKWLGLVNGREFLDAVERQYRLLIEEAPRWKNGAISHRWEGEEVWSDAVAMVPPFLAYYGVAKDDVKILREAVNQIEKYREVLRIEDAERRGLWMHIVGGEKADEGAWSTGNAWVAYGIARTRATISAWEGSNVTLREEVERLDGFVKEVLDAVIETDDDASGLLRNYLGDGTYQGETSGTSLLAATAYRMAVLKPVTFGTQKYLEWAHKKRGAVTARVDDDGFAKPAANPYDHKSHDYVDGSPEGESFLLLLGTAWRDCVCSGLCLETYRKENSIPLDDPVTAHLPADVWKGYALYLQEYVAGWRRYFQAP